MWLLFLFAEMVRLLIPVLHMSYPCYQLPLLCFADMVRLTIVTLAAIALPLASASHRWPSGYNRSVTQLDLADLTFLHDCYILKLLLHFPLTGWAEEPLGVDPALETQYQDSRQDHNIQDRLFHPQTSILPTTSILPIRSHYSPILPKSLPNSLVSLPTPIQSLTISLPTQTGRENAFPATWTGADPARASPGDRYISILSNINLRIGSSN